jgi:ubiquinone/menaquinone biosynthesis C-methylase UbiE
MRGRHEMDELYKNRKLAQGYPGLDDLAFERKYSSTLDEKGNEGPDGDISVEMLLKWLDRLVDLGELRNVLVLGCGPRPLRIKALTQKNYNAVGVEPVASFVRSAREYHGSPDRILEGSAEEIPLPSYSQDLVICESVLEHVDSPTKSLDEIFRVLGAGGIAFIETTNRYRISLKGENAEYNVRFFNWLPDIVKESFVFHHLHYDPSLANYSLRPAVHWYSYADLCRLGRQAGFGQFYSVLDLLDTSDPLVSKSRVRNLLLNKLKFNPWLRALTLTQRGTPIFMLKRR